MLIILTVIVRRSSGRSLRLKRFREPFRPQPLSVQYGECAYL